MEFSVALKDALQVELRIKGMVVRSDNFGEPLIQKILSRDGNFACRIHPAAQSVIGEQQWVTGFHYVCVLL